MDDINVLTSTSSTSNELVAAANNMITNYDLHFSATDIITAFERAQKWKPQVTQTVGDALHLLLTNNLNMFIATLYALLDDTNKMPCEKWYKYLIQGGIDPRYMLGHLWLLNTRWVIPVYCTLYDYHKFDITKVALQADVREQIQQHINNKLTYTKPALVSKADFKK